MKSSFWSSFIWISAWRNLMRNPRRTVFSLLSVALATAAILVCESFKQSLIRTTRKNVISSHYAHYEITKKDYYTGKVDDPFGYQMESIGDLRGQIETKVGTLSYFSRRQEFFGFLNFNNRSFGASGLAVDANEDKKFMTLARVVDGVHLADSSEDSIFIGAGVAKSLDVKVGDTVTLLVTTAGGSLNALDLKICGLFKTGINDLDERAFYVHQSLLESLLKVKGSSKVLIGFSDEDELKFQKPLEDLLSSNFPDLAAVHWLKRAPFYDNLVGWIKKQISVFYVIILLISTISIVNIFTMGLLERTGEFGTFRALGTFTGELSALIFVESMMQALLGSILGMVIGLFVILVPLHNGVWMPPPPMMSAALLVKFSIPWAQMIPILLSCSLVSGISGIFPAIKMARINIVKALGRNV